jgi:hypothetical protein
MSQVVEADPWWTIARFLAAGPEDLRLLYQACPQRRLDRWEWSPDGTAAGAWPASSNAGRAERGPARKRRSRHPGSPGRDPIDPHAWRRPLGRRPRSIPRPSKEPVCGPGEVHVFPVVVGRACAACRGLEPLSSVPQLAAAHVRQPDQRTCSSRSVLAAVTATHCFPAGSRGLRPAGSRDLRWVKQRRAHHRLVGGRSERRPSAPPGARADRWRHWNGHCGVLGGVRRRRRDWRRGLRLRRLNSRGAWAAARHAASMWSIRGRPSCPEWGNQLPG